MPETPQRTLAQQQLLPPPVTAASAFSDANAAFPDYNPAAIAETDDSPPHPSVCESMVGRLRSCRVPSLEVEHDAVSGSFRIWWTVDSRKLKGTDREAVSPGFELVLATGSAQFKMIIRPSSSRDSLGGASFRNAQGRGSVEVRCLERVDETQDQPLRFRLAVGACRTWGEEARGPMEHLFSGRALYKMPEATREWDFSRHADCQSQTFDVCLEILGGAVGAKAVVL